MDINTRLTKADVDKEIKILKESRGVGEDNIKLYKIKLENLQTIRSLLIKEKQHGRKKENNQRDASRGAGRNF